MTTRTSARRGALAALALAAAAVVTLAGCVSAPVNVIWPDTAPDADFSDYAQQQPRWADCGSGIECAEVYAPLDWADPAGERITLHLAKHPAENGAPIGTLFVNPGGPGASGADLVANYVDAVVGSALREQYDVIGWDPRGVGQSSAVACLDDAEFDEYLYGTGDPETDGAFLEPGSDEWIQMSIDLATAFGEACYERTGELLAHIDTDSTVRDLDMLRGIVGDPQLNYLGFSYGTQIGALYADMFPERAGRLVLDGAVDPSSPITEVSQVQAIGFDLALRNYVTDCLTRSSCPLRAQGATDADSGMEQISALFDQVEAEPIRADDGRMLYDSTMFTAVSAALYSQSLWPELDTLFTEVAKGRAEHGFLLADYYADRVNGVYQTNLLEAFSAINCLDYPRVSELDFDAMRAEAAETARLAPIAGRYMAYGDIGCANWPVPEVNVARTVSGAGAAPILVIGTTGDPATPYRWAESLASQLESGVLITFEGEGHTAYGSSACIDAVIEEFLLTGVAPTGDVTCSS